MEQLKMAKITAKTYWRNYYLIGGQNSGGMDWKSLELSNWYLKNAVVKQLYRIKITMKENRNASFDRLHNRPKQSPEDRRSVWQ
jgi:hypothetical protein